MKDFKPNILVVDDEPFNRDIIDRYLEDEGYELTEASDGDEALEILVTSPNKFDVVILDRMMPNLNGLEVLNIIKKDPVLSTIPVILQTARSSKEDIREGIDAGAYFYLTKPFDEDVLLSMVRSAVNEREKALDLKASLAEDTLSLGMMRHGCFQFRTLEEAHALSMYLAKSCPEPEKTIFGLSELFINAVEHGNLGITYDDKSTLNEEGEWLSEVNKRLELPENKNKFVDVTFKRTESEINVVIQDKGKGFDWGQYMSFSPDRVFDNHGRGIASSSMMSLDNLTYNESGNEATATIYLEVHVESHGESTFKEASNV